MSSWLQSLSSHIEEKLARVKANSLSASAPTLPTATPPVGVQASWSSSSAYSSTSGSDSGSNGPATLSGPAIPSTAQTTSSSLSTTVKSGMSTLFSLASPRNVEEIGEDSEFWAPTAWLTIHLVEGKDLEVADRSGTSDPYVVFRVKGGNGKVESVKSSVVPKTLNPKWNETYNLLIWKGTTELEVEVFDKDLVKDDELGSGTIELQSLTTAPFVRVSSWLQLKKVKRGSLNIALVFRPLGSGSLDDESPCNSRPRDEYGFPMSQGAVEAKKRLSKIVTRTSKEQKKNWQRFNGGELRKNRAKSKRMFGREFRTLSAVKCGSCSVAAKKKGSPIQWYTTI